VNYDCLLNWFRVALVQTCGLTKTEAMSMGTHSNRRLGNNRAQDVGIAGNVQLEFGEWATDVVAVTKYLAFKKVLSFSCI